MLIVVGLADEGGCPGTYSMCGPTHRLAKYKKVELCDSILLCNFVATS